MGLAPERSVPRWDLIKLNEVEARQLLQQDYSLDQLEAAARRLAGQTQCSRICITAGAAGAGLLAGSQWHWVASRSIDVKDTVGAGDAFLAALVHGLLRGGRCPEDILPFACRLAEFVASQEGATPAYRVEPSGEISANCY